jgi:hypothetical protein
MRAEGPSCAECSVPATRNCSGCRTVIYCSTTCQRAAWPAHRQACKEAAAAYAAASDAASNSNDPVDSLPPPGTFITISSVGIAGMDPRNAVESTLDAGSMREQIHDLRRMQAAGKTFRVDRVLASLRAADVRALSEFRGSSRAAHDAWSALLEDVAIYRAARAAFDGEPVPFVLASGTSPTGSRGGIVDQRVPGGITINSPERGLMHLAPPAGATLRYNEKNSSVEAVWEDGRVTTFAQIKLPESGARERS